MTDSAPKNAVRGRNRVGGATALLHCPAITMSDTLGVEVVCSEVEGEKALPLVLRALDGKDSLDYLKSWMAANRSWLEEKMVEHGTQGVVTPIMHLASRPFAS